MALWKVKRSPVSRSSRGSQRIGQRWHGLSRRSISGDEFWDGAANGPGFNIVKAASAEAGENSPKPHRGQSWMVVSLWNHSDTRGRLLRCLWCFVGDLPEHVHALVCVFRSWLRFEIGSDNPLAAAIIAECSKKRPSAHSSPQSSPCWGSKFRLLVWSHT